MVVAQLVEQSFLIPEVRGSNPVIGKNLFWTFYCQLYRKDENKEKEAGNGPFLIKENVTSNLKCDQMDKLFGQYFSILNNANLPNSFKCSFQFFSKYLLNLDLDPVL